MRTFTLVAMLIPLVLLAGCAKKTAKAPAPSNDETAEVKPPPQPIPPVVIDKDKPKAKPDEPNWLTDPKKDQPTGPKTDNKQPWVKDPPKGGWEKPDPEVKPMPPMPQPGINPTPVAPAPHPGQPNAGGMGKLDPQPQPVNPKPPVVEPAPVGNPVTEADMKDVWIFIENFSGASGKMPPPALTYQALIQAKSQAAALVKSGSIVLTGSTARESIWAVDMQGFMQGGNVLIATQTGVETITAAQLKQRLGK